MTRSIDTDYNFTKASLLVRFLTFVAQIASQQFIRKKRLAFTRTTIEPRGAVQSQISCNEWAINNDTTKRFRNWNNARTASVTP